MTPFPRLSIDQLEAAILDALRLWHMTDAKGTPRKRYIFSASFINKTEGVCATPAINFCARN